MKNKRKYQSVLFEFFTLSQQCGMGKADYEAAFVRLDADDQLVIEALCLEMEEKVDHKGFGKMCQLELLAKLGMWLSDNGGYVDLRKSKVSDSSEGIFIGESPFESFMRKGTINSNIPDEVRESWIEYLNNQRPIILNEPMEITYGLDHSAGNGDLSCVSFVTQDAEGKIVVLGCSFDEDVVKLVYRKAMEPGNWSDEDEKALNEAVGRFRDGLRFVDSWPSPPLDWARGAASEVVNGKSV